MEEDLRQLIAECTEQSHNPLANGGIDAFCAKHSLTRASFFELFARHVAEAFMEGSLAFWNGNHAMNALAGGMTEIDGFALEVFLAFDHGEYLEGGEPPDSVPWQYYTLPMIRAALANAGNAPRS
ncbi:MAG: hypothetical protein ACTHOH_13040 [Lysobacteraceae bacterium]